MELATCDKYYDKLSEKFPELSRKQIDKIIKHGLMVLYMLNLYGGDVLLKNPDYTMYFGKLFNNKIMMGKYALIKWRIKLRIKYKRSRKKYDGYYYFGLSTDALEKQNYIGNNKKRIMHFEHIKLYKILEECMVDRRFDHFFRVKYPEDCGFTMWKENYDIKNPEYIYRRNKDKIIEPVSYERNRNKCVKRRVK